MDFAVSKIIFLFSLENRKLKCLIPFLSILIFVLHYPVFEHRHKHFYVISTMWVLPEIPAYSREGPAEPDEISLCTAAAPGCTRFSGYGLWTSIAPRA